MAKKLFIFLVLGLFLPILSSAGELNLTVINEKKNVPVIKYIARYGLEEKLNPAEYPYCMEIIPPSPVIGEFHGMVKVEVNGVGVFMSVQDVYADGTVTPFSESSFQMNLPAKVSRVRFN